jgi:hypothetical protein
MIRSVERTYYYCTAPEELLSPLYQKDWLQHDVSERIYVNIAEPANHNVAANLFLLSN